MRTEGVRTEGVRTEGVRTEGLSPVWPKDYPWSR